MVLRKFTKVPALCIVVFLALSLFGCKRISNIINSSNSNTSNSTSTSSIRSDLFSPRSGASAVDSLYNAILNRDESCDLSSFHLSDAEFSRSFDLEQMLCENPAIDYITSYRRHSTNGVITKVSFEYMRIPADYQTRLGQAVSSAVDSIMEQLQDDYKQAELVCVINDYIAVNCQYAYKPDGITPDDDTGGNAYSALVERRAVCDGYSGAFTLLAQQFGLEVKKISGVSGPNNASHAWNLVKVDGQWYHVDTTWNDPTPDTPGRARHDYLLLSDATIASQRFGSLQYHASWDVSIPKASDARYEDAFWVYEDTPVSFKNMHFDEWEQIISQTTFEEIITTAVEHNTEANIARFGYDKDRFLEELHKIYSNIGCTYTINAEGIVVKAGNWETA